MPGNVLVKTIGFGLMAAGIWYPAKAQKIISEPAVSVTNDLEYAKAAVGRSRSLMLDVYCSLQASHAKQPAIMFIHGGGFWEGDKRSALYVKMASAFARHGYVAFSVNYTLKDQAEPFSPRLLERSVSELAAAMRWIRANSGRFNIDTRRLLVCGDSAGGGIAVNLSFDSANRDYFCGCIDLWGGLPRDNSWNAPLFTGALGSHTPPTCFIHGTEDRIVPFYISKNLDRKLKAAAVYQEIHPLKNADHYPVQLADQFIPLMTAFADKIISSK